MEKSIREVMTQMKVADIASEEISTVEPDQELSEAIRIVSMGDLTIERDLSWTLMDVSAAPPNE